VGGNYRCDPAEREDVVPIQARVRDLDSEPALGHLRFREIADGESGQRIVRDCLGGVNGKHCQVLSLSSFDKQRGNLVALEREVVAELDRTSWKAAADISGDNRLVTDFGDVGHLGVRLIFFVHLITPLFDCSAAMLPVLVSDECVLREGSNHGVRLVGIGSLEIIRYRLR